MLWPEMTAVRCERTSALLSDDASLAAAFAALPAWRRRKAESFRFEADRRLSIAVWLLLRQMLAERGLNADSLPVSEDEFGKPAFEPSLGIHFNLSHAGERVMAAVSDRPVGCDVERIVPFDEGVARECLTDEELSWIGRQPSGSERDTAFLLLWVRKEAYVKAVGRGLGIDLKSFSVLPGQCPADWFFRDLDYPDGHLGCVVYKGVECFPHEGHRHCSCCEGRSHH